MNLRYKRINVSSIHVDPEVQRALRPSWVQTLASDFDPNKLGIIHVAENGTGETFLVLDGQHRLAAMKKLGLADTTVRCLVYEGTDQAENAGLFRDLNRQKTVRAFDIFRVSVTEGDPDAVEIYNIVKSLGLEVSDQKDAGCVRATRALEKLYTGKALRLKGGPYPGALRMTLRILIDAWGYDANAFDAPIIEALGAVVLRFGDDIDAKRFAQKLAARPGGPTALQAHGRGLAKMKHTQLRNAVAELLVETYNNSLRSNALPAWERA